MVAPGPHAHVVVKVSPDEILMIRRVRDGRVYHVAPGTAILAGETPGVAAIRTAREELGIAVEVEEMIHAQAFAGVDHFFFVAHSHGPVEHAVLARPHDDFDLERELGGTFELVRLRTRLLLAYDVRPREIALRLGRSSAPGRARLA
jgi:8-oxo-dGTP diphosphatase